MAFALVPRRWRGRWLLQALVYEPCVGGGDGIRIVLRRGSMPRGRLPPVALSLRLSLLLAAGYGHAESTLELLQLALELGEGLCDRAVHTP